MRHVLRRANAHVALRVTPKASCIVSCVLLHARKIPNLTLSRPSPGMRKKVFIWRACKTWKFSTGVTPTKHHPGVTVLSGCRVQRRLPHSCTVYWLHITRDCPTGLRQRPHLIVRLQSLSTCAISSSFWRFLLINFSKVQHIISLYVASVFSGCPSYVCYHSFLSPVALVCCMSGSQTDD